VTGEQGSTVVVDCGFDPEVGRRRGREVLADPVEALAAVGINAGAVRRVVVTHAHYDHIGTLHRFPAAEIVVARRELDFWAGPLAGRTQFAHATEPDELAVLARAAEPWTGRSSSSPTSPRCTPASTCCARSPRAPATCSWPGTTRRWPSGSRAGSTAPASTTS
jgi:hypothetical protein